jgi:mersacidin/lichenicidin family type 2 lantibiotic
MSPETIIRAWKDPSFRAHLTLEQQEALPENPSGKPMSELGDEEMADVVGGVPLYPPTPPVLNTRARWCVPQGTSAVDACPSRGCTVLFPCEL